MQLHTFSTTRTARYYSLGEPGPAIRHVWFCLHSHNESVADFAIQLRPLDTPERLLVLPEGLARYDHPDADSTTASNPLAAWFAIDATTYDLPDVAHYLETLAQQILATCPPGTPVTVLGHGHGALAACQWLANSELLYDRLVLYAAVFPPEINRHALLAGLPKRPVVVVATTADVYTSEAAGEGLVQDLHNAGLEAQLRHASDGSITLAALGASTEPPV
jgi:predicted esterase